MALTIAQTLAKQNVESGGVGSCLLGFTGCRGTAGGEDLTTEGEALQAVTMEE